jgi:hypothetical protein
LCRKKRGGAAVVNRLAEILRETIAERAQAVRSER